MRSPPWKRLVEQLKSDGFESPYLERLSQRLVVDRDSAHAELEKEIRAEMAAALGRTEDKVNLALLELDVAGKAVDAAEGGPRDALVAAITEYNRLREAAERALRDLMIHREAIGIRQHKLLADFYPIPPRRRLP